MAETYISTTGRSAGPRARPLPTRIHFTDGQNPGAAVGVGGALHPEWDVFKGRYRAEWCRVIDHPLTTSADKTDVAPSPPGCRAPWRRTPPRCRPALSPLSRQARQLLPMSSFE